MIDTVKLSCGEKFMTDDSKINWILSTKIPIEFCELVGIRIWDSAKDSAKSVEHDIFAMNIDSTSNDNVHNKYYFYDDLVKGNYLYVMLTSNRQSARSMLPILCNRTKHKVKDVLWFEKSIVVVLKKYGECNTWQ